MNQKIKNYIVSSAGWEIEIDDIDPSSAAVSGLLFAFKKFGKKLLVSTVIMVNLEEGHKENDLTHASFFPTYKVMSDLGMDFLSKEFLELTNSINETKYT